MALDDETRKVIHDLRSTINDMVLANTKRQLEQEKSMALLQQELHTLNERLGKAVSREEFMPVKVIVFGMTAMVLSSAFGAIISLIFIK